MMAEFTIKNKCGEIVSRHKSLELANAKLRKIDAVKYSLYADDVDWLTGHEEALQGYNCTVQPANPKGAGRKPAPPNLKKKSVHMKLPRWLIEWTAKQEQSRAVLVEEALKKVHGLETPAPIYDGDGE